MQRREPDRRIGACPQTAQKWLYFPRYVHDDMCVVCATIARFSAVIRPPAPLWRRGFVQVGHIRAVKGEADEEDVERRAVLAVNGRGDHRLDDLNGQGLLRGLRRWRRHIELAERTARDDHGTAVLIVVAVLRRLEDVREVRKVVGRDRPRPRLVGGHDALVARVGKLGAAIAVVRELHQHRVGDGVHVALPAPQVALEGAQRRQVLGAVALALRLEELICPDEEVQPEVALAHRLLQPPDNPVRVLALKLKGRDLRGLRSEPVAEVVGLRDDDGVLDLAAAREVGGPGGDGGLDEAAHAGERHADADGIGAVLPLAPRHGLDCDTRHI